MYSAVGVGYKSYSFQNKYNDSDTEAESNISYFSQDNVGSGTIEPKYLAQDIKTTVITNLNQQELHDGIRTVSLLLKKKCLNTPQFSNKQLVQAYRGHLTHPFGLKNYDIFRSYLNTSARLQNKVLQYVGILHNYLQGSKINSIDNIELLKSCFQQIIMELHKASYKNFINIEFYGVDFTNFTFSGGVFTSATFKDCILKNTRFVECNMSKVNFLNSRLEAAEFIRCKLLGASFDAYSAIGIKTLKNSNLLGMYCPHTIKIAMSGYSNSGNIKFYTVGHPQLVGHLSQLMKCFRHGLFDMENDKQFILELFTNNIDSKQINDLQVNNICPILAEMPVSENLCAIMYDKNLIQFYDIYELVRWYAACSTNLPKLCPLRRVNLEQLYKSSISVPLEARYVKNMEIILPCFLNLHDIKMRLAK